jgi:hypothetical protein
MPLPLVRAPLNIIVLLRVDPFEGCFEDTADMIEASSEEAAAVDSSSSGIQVTADADAECVAGTGAGVADAAIEMQEGDIAAGLSPVFLSMRIPLTPLLADGDVTGARADEAHAESEASLHDMDHCDVSAAAHSITGESVGE